MYGIDMKGEIINERTGWYDDGYLYPLRKHDESFFTATDCFYNEKQWQMEEDK